MVKPIKHKPTFPPMQCNHCEKIWYGAYHKDSGQGVVGNVVPIGEILCGTCWNDLDNYLYQYDTRTWIEIDNMRREDYKDTEWKKDYPQFFKKATDWIRNKSPRKRKYDSSVPVWMRSAIDSGKVEVSSNYVYTIESYGNDIVLVEKTLDRSGLSKSRSKTFW